MMIDTMFLINVLPFPQYELRDDMKNAVVVVIDVLRATTSILEALQNGAYRIIPVSDSEQAMKLRAKYAPEPVLISGERGGLKIDGFDLGNSPVEFTVEVVSGKNIMICSTNGTKAILYASASKTVYLACFRNLLAVVDKLRQTTSDIFIVCSGKLDEFCMEDMACAGAIVDMLSMSAQEYQLSDSAKTARILYLNYKNDLLRLMQESEHGQYLTSLGMASDLNYCAEINISPLVPQLVNGIIVQP
jgi:2-phosphosulfolactate phosphatase